VVCPSGHPIVEEHEAKRASHPMTNSNINVDNVPGMGPGPPVLIVLTVVEQCGADCSPLPFPFITWDENNSSEQSEKRHRRRATDTSAYRIIVGF